MRWPLVLPAACLVGACTMPSAEAQEPSTYERADARLQVGDFEAAAALFEQSAVESASCTSDAWDQSLHVHLALAQTDAAAAEVSTFARLCGRRHPEHVALMHLQIAEDDETRDETRGAAAAAEAAIPWATRASSEVLLATARVRLARVLWQGDRRRAEALLAAVIAAATNRKGVLADP